MGKFTLYSWTHSYGLGGCLEKYGAGICLSNDFENIQNLHKVIDDDYDNGYDEADFTPYISEDDEPVDEMTFSKIAEFDTMNQLTDLKRKHLYFVSTMKELINRYPIVKTALGYEEYLKNKNNSTSTP